MLTGMCWGELLSLMSRKLTLKFTFKAQHIPGFRGETAEGMGKRLPSAERAGFTAGRQVRNRKYPENRSRILDANSVRM